MQQERRIYSRGDKEYFTQSLSSPRHSQCSQLAQHATQNAFFRVHPPQNQNGLSETAPKLPMLPMLVWPVVPAV